jgi:hypothetical protein
MLEQASQVDDANFPPQLLEELSAVKAAALRRRLRLPPVAHLAENIGPRQVINDPMPRSRGITLLIGIE